MTNHAGTVDSIEVGAVRHERLLGIKSQIHPDTNAATCGVAFTNQDPFPVFMPLRDISLAAAELRRVEAMLYRRMRRKVYTGTDYLDEIAEMALAPTDIEVTVNPMTADSVFILHFAHQGPIALRFTPEMERVGLAKLAMARQIAAN